MCSVLEHVATYPIKAEGQGIAWNRSDPGVLWMISRQNKEPIAQRIVRPKQRSALGTGVAAEGAR